jgi:hypothetical protein
MAGLLNRLAPKGYPGQIFVCMLRYGYGTQQHLEKMEILHNWYSHLRSYLPEKLAKKQEEYDLKYADLMNEACNAMNAAFEKYKPEFEGLQTCDPNEKLFIMALWGVYERLDEITAKAKIIDNIQSEDEESDVIG